MACIDKTYTDSFSDYQKLVEWAKNNKFICPNGLEINILDSIYNRTEESFKNGEMAVMNTSYTEDYFLIKYCPLEFVQNRMKEVYNKDYYDSIKNGTSEYDKFVYPEIGTHFTIIRDKCMKHKDYLWKFHRHRIKFDITVEYKDISLWYNEELKRFLLPDELGDPTASWSSKTYTIKALLRYIRKLKLPKGAIVTAQGRYINESLLILVK